jgi:hypothetical protein
MSGHVISVRSDLLFYFPLNPSEYVRLGWQLILISSVIVQWRVSLHNFSKVDSKCIIFSRHNSNFHTVATEETYVIFRHLSDLQLQWCINCYHLAKGPSSFPRHIVRTNYIAPSRFHCTSVRISRYTTFLYSSTWWLFCKYRYVYLNWIFGPFTAKVAKTSPVKLLHSFRVFAYNDM